MPVNPDNNCGTCIYYQPSNILASKIPVCKRYPPTVIPAQGTQPPLTNYPEPPANDWCGEYRNENQ